jgi:hypothetical protein
LAGTSGEGSHAPGFDTSVPNVARIYDYLIGGKDNFDADRKAADALLEAMPDARVVARDNREFLGRAIRFLAAEAGIRQFLDIGTGLPTQGNVHQLAQSVAPESRVVYVDYDPVVLSHARALMTSTPQGATAYVDADLRDTGKILAEAAKMLDFSQPVAVTLLAILHFIPDEDDPYGIVARLKDAMAPGSYLIITHSTDDDIDADTTVQVRQVYENASARTKGLSHAEIMRFFDGLELIPPGLVNVASWHPGHEQPALNRTVLYAGVARKPAAT